MTSSNGSIPLYCPFVTGHVEFPSQRPVARNFDVFLDLRMNKRLSKQWRRRWFETPLHSLWRHCKGRPLWFLRLLQLLANRVVPYFICIFRDARLRIWHSLQFYGYGHMWLWGAQLEWQTSMDKDSNIWSDACWRRGPDRYVTSQWYMHNVIVTSCMEIISAFVALCEENSPVTSGFPLYWTFVVGLNKL